MQAVKGGGELQNSQIEYSMQPTFNKGTRLLRVEIIKTKVSTKMSSTRMSSSLIVSTNNYISWFMTQVK